MEFYHEWIDINEYVVRGSDGRKWSKNDELYVTFCQNNTPVNKSGNELIEIVNGQPQELATKQAILDAKRDALIESNTEVLWQAAHDYEYAEINGSSIALLVLGVLQNKPISLAIKAWIQSIWLLYYSRKLLVTEVLDPLLNDFSSCGPMPHTVPELMAELEIQ